MAGHQCDGRPGGDDRRRGGEFVDPVRDVEGLAGVNGNCLQSMHKRKSIVDGHPFFIDEVGDADARRVGEAVPVRHGNVQGFTNQRQDGGGFGPGRTVLKAVRDDQIVVGRQGREILLSHILVMADQPRTPLTGQVLKQGAEVRQTRAVERAETYRGPGILEVLADGLIGRAHRYADVDGGAGQGLTGTGQDKGPSPPLGEGNLHPTLQRGELLRHS